jgi:RHS repeat-associated protein
LEEAGERRREAPSTPGWRQAYNRFRYYDPELGRYLSEDPIGLGGSIGFFEYPKNPLGLVDPFGLACRVANRTDAASGLDIGKTLTEKQALARLRRGQDVFVDSLAEAKSLAKRAFPGKPMHHDLYWFGVNKTAGLG